ncbi:ethanolamine permease [Desertivirga arenae]|uniref:ethanolamine permease n=1 Tax=Desertivirga arenae TaxID=2810309 RepID=UPI001A964CAE|nr:ethanolamine permease [Pedobacter sp. SYSU D00823]
MILNSTTSLKKALKPLHVWAIAVGLVISGEYFGWNYGWGVAGTVGFLISTLLVTVMYVTFIFSFTELTTSIPNAGGPFEYAFRAFGKWGGFVSGYATLIEFVLAPPAIAFALGAYVNFLYPALPVVWVAIGSYVIFTGINLLGIKESATFSLIVTLLAVAELLLFIGIVAPSYQTENFMRDSMPYGWQGVFAALPFAIWFYLAIEGVALVAEEVEDPHRNIPKGYISGILTLVALALGVMIFTGGIGDWKKLSNIDYPLPESIGMVLGKSNSLTKLFAGIGLFGLIASFHSIIIGYSREIFALARSGFLPAVLSQVHSRTQVPHWALLAGAFVGIVSILSGTTNQVIVLSVLGAVVMYIMSMFSLFRLRKKEPDMERPYKAPFYPLFPLLALLLSLVSLTAIVYYNLLLSLLFLSGMLIMAALFYLTDRGKKNNDQYHKLHQEELEHGI